MPVRIVHVASTSDPASGVVSVIVHLASALARRGHEVHLWQLPEWSRPATSEHLERLEAAGVRQVVVQRPFSWRDAGAAVARLEQQCRPDIVHVHSVFHPVNTAVVRALRAPFALSPHGGYDPVSLRRSAARKVAYRALFERRMVGRAAVLFALSEAEERQIRAFGPAGPVAVIPNGVSRPPETVDKGALRRDLGLAEGTRVVLYVGRIDVRHKGLDVLLSGVAEAPGWHLALVGPDHRGGQELLRRRADTLGVRERVHFCGPRSGRLLDEALRGAQLFGLMSRWEGFPMALLESLARGTPAVVSPAVERVTGVVAAEAAWQASPGALGATLSSIAGLDASEWRRRRAAAVTYARRHDWDVLAARYEAAYERACSTTPRR